MKAATAPRPALDFTAPPGIVEEKVDPTTATSDALLPADNDGRVSAGDSANAGLPVSYFTNVVDCGRPQNARGAESGRRSND